MVQNAAMLIEELKMNVALDKGAPICLSQFSN